MLNQCNLVDHRGIRGEKDRGQGKFCPDDRERDSETVISVERTGQDTGGSEKGLEAEV